MALTLIMQQMGRYTAKRLPVKWWIRTVPNFNTLKTFLLNTWYFVTVYRNTSSQIGMAWILSWRELAVMCVSLCGLVSNLCCTTVTRYSDKGMKGEHELLAPVSICGTFKSLSMHLQWGRNSRLILSRCKPNIESRVGCSANRTP